MDFQGPLLEVVIKWAGSPIVLGYAIPASNQFHQKDINFEAPQLLTKRAFFNKPYLQIEAAFAHLLPLLPYETNFATSFPSIAPILLNNQSGYEFLRRKRKNERKKWKTCSSDASFLTHHTC